MLRNRPTTRRAGVASVEAALVLSLVVVPVMIGVWEVGRLVYCQQVIANAAREGCRLAAQGRTVNSSGTPTQILRGTQAAADPANPNVWDTVYQAVCTGGLPGLSRGDVFITYQFIDGAPNRDPAQGLKGERFRVTVYVDWSKVRWVNLGLISPTHVYYQADWQMLVDDPFVANTTMPVWTTSP